MASSWRAACSACQTGLDLAALRQHRFIFGQACLGRGPGLDLRSARSRWARSRRTRSSCQLACLFLRRSAGSGGWRRLFGFGRSQASPAALHVAPAPPAVGPRMTGRRASSRSMPATSPWMRSTWSCVRRPPVFGLLLVAVVARQAQDIAQDLLALAGGLDGEGVGPALQQEGRVDEGLVVHAQRADDLRLALDQAALVQQLPVAAGPVAVRARRTNAGRSARGPSGCADATPGSAAGPGRTRTRPTSRSRPA